MLNHLNSTFFSRSVFRNPGCGGGGGHISPYFPNSPFLTTVGGWQVRIWVGASIHALSSSCLSFLFPCPPTLFFLHFILPPEYAPVNQQDISKRWIYVSLFNAIEYQGYDVIIQMFTNCSLLLPFQIFHQHFFIHPD